VGIFTNVFAYIPVFILIELFKRTSSRKTKSTRLQNIIKNLTDQHKIDFAIKNINGEEKIKKKVILFPWWFKFVLYTISYICMATSVCLILFKGTTKSSSQK